MTPAPTIACILGVLPRQRRPGAGNGAPDTEGARTLVVNFEAPQSHVYHGEAFLQPRDAIVQIALIFLHRPPPPWWPTGPWITEGNGEEPVRKMSRIASWLRSAHLLSSRSRWKTQAHWRGPIPNFVNFTNSRPRCPRHSRRTHDHDKPCPVLATIDGLERNRFPSIP